MISPSNAVPAATIGKARARSTWNAARWVRSAKIRSRLTRASGSGSTGRLRLQAAKEVVHRLLDIVGKNGNLLLSIPLLPDGTLDIREESILEDFTA